MYITGELWYIINMKKLIIAIVLLLIGFVCFVKADYDQTVVAATLILEAGGEYDKGSMEAVYEVIHNRSVKRNKSYDEICLQKKQFSCWNDKNIDNNIKKASQHPRWDEAIKITNKKPITNYTKGADHYHADYVNPYWAKSLVNTTKIGRHIFYK